MDSQLIKDREALFGTMKTPIPKQEMDISAIGLG